MTTEARLSEVGRCDIEFCYAQPEHYFTSPNAKPGGIGHEDLRTVLPLLVTKGARDLMLSPLTVLWPVILTPIRLKNDAVHRKTTLVALEYLTLGRSHE